MPSTGTGTPTNANQPIINPFSNIQSDPIRNFRFIVQFLPKQTYTNQVKFTPSIGFTNVSGLTVSIDAIPYREGGFNTNMHYLPGQASFTPITFLRGQTLGGKQHSDWLRQLFAVVQGKTNSFVGSNFRCDLEISVLSHPNPRATSGSNAGMATTPKDMHTSMRFKVYNAWINSLAYGDLSSGGNGLMVEGMSVVHEGFEVTYGTNLTKAGSAAAINY